MYTGLDYRKYFQVIFRLSFMIIILEKKKILKYWNVAGTNKKVHESYELYFQKLCVRMQIVW